MIILFILVANQIAVQCINAVCTEIPYQFVRGMIAAGVLELVLEIRGFVSIYKNRDK